MHTYTVALSDIRHPETGAVLVKRLGIVSPDTANHLRQKYKISIHGTAVPTYPDAVCVVENFILEDLERAQRAEVRAQGLVRTIYAAAVDDGEGDDVLARWLAPPTPTPTPTLLGSFST